MDQKTVLFAGIKHEQAGMCQRGFIVGIVILGLIKRIDMGDVYTDDKVLCQWLRQNSSGIYRPSAHAAERIEYLLIQNKALQELLERTENELRLANYRLIFLKKEK